MLPSQACQASSAPCCCCTIAGGLLHLSSRVSVKSFLHFQFQSDRLVMTRGYRTCPHRHVTQQQFRRSIYTCRICPTARSVCAGSARQDFDQENRIFSNIMDSIRCWLGPQTNQNVSCIFIYKLSNGIARGVWSHASMATYIYLLENQSAKVPSHYCIPVHL